MTGKRVDRDWRRAPMPVWPRRAACTRRFRHTPGRSARHSDVA